LRQKPVGEGRWSPPPFPFPPSPFPFPLTFQTNQWEGTSDPVRGEFPGFPPYNITLEGFPWNFITALIFELKN